jgi:serine protease Do
VKVPLKQGDRISFTEDAPCVLVDEVSIVPRYTGESAENTITVKKQRPFFVAAGLGTSFAVGRKGLLCTNSHVIENAVYVYVKYGQDYIPAFVSCKNKASDIALLTVSFATRPLDTRVPLDNDIGTSVFAIGFPWSAVTGERPTITRGILSGISKDGNYLITDAAINKGNSGGPLIDTEGRVLGINTFIVRDNGIEGGGFAINIRMIEEVLY